MWQTDGQTMTNDKGAFNVDCMTVIFLWRNT